MDKSTLPVEDLLREITRLEKEVERLQRIGPDIASRGDTVIVPEQFREIFQIAEKNVAKYFESCEIRPENAEILINGERYVLMRSAAISYEFLDVFKELYANRGEEEAVRIGNNFLFDIAHVLGKEDAKEFHRKMKLEDPVQKLSAGPVHFAYTGWANVEILPESKPSPDEHFYLKYHHHNSFEAQAWIKAKRKSDVPVCIMNSGYSSGWCAESFGLPLTAVEITCEACGADRCTFIMAPPDKIQTYLEQEQATRDAQHEVPVFFQRKYAEDKLKESLQQKETLLREVHHRVKNNLQIVSSLLKLQQGTIEDPALQDKFTSSIMRVNTMAKIHEMIYGDKDLSSINIEKYFTRLLRSLAQVYGSEKCDVNMQIEIDPKELLLIPDKAIPLGLILNEIATNSFKYAFVKKGTFYLKLTRIAENESYLLVVGDDGSGLPEDLDRSSLGLSIVEILCDQIDARLEVKNSSDGLEYRIEFRN